MGTQIFFFSGNMGHPHHTKIMIIKKCPKIQLIYAKTKSEKQLITYKWLWKSNVNENKSDHAKCKSWLQSYVNPSNAGSAFVQSAGMQIFLKTF